MTLPTPQKFVLLAIAKHANDDGFAWPSVKRLVELTSISESSVHRALLKLKEYGLIEVTRRNHNCLYQLNLERKSHALQPTASLTEPTASLTEPTANLTEPTVTMTPEYIKEEVKGIDNLKILHIPNTRTQKTTSGDRLDKSENRTRDHSKGGSFNSHSSLHNVWHEEMPRWTGGAMVMPLTQGEQSALKTFANAVGETAPNVLRMVLHRWEEFMEYLCDHEGVKNPSRLPNVLLIVKCRQAAAIFAHEGRLEHKELKLIAPPKKAMAAAPPVVNVAPVVKSGRSATLEEVEAILAKLEKTSA